MTDPQEFDVEVLARMTVDMLGVSPGQVIWIWGSLHSLDPIILEPTVRLDGRRILEVGEFRLQGK